jgi:hypothetical protein
MQRSLRFFFAPLTQKATIIALIAISFLWTLYCSVGIEIFRPPWEDEILYSLPAINWLKTGVFAIPQLGNFEGANEAWGWHMPGFTVGLAAWLSIFPFDFWSLRLYSILPAAVFLFFLSLLIINVIGNRSLFIILIICLCLFFDKTFLMLAPCGGRMELHACLWLCLAFFILGFNFRNNYLQKLRYYLGGAFYSLAVLFHPIAIYFAPAYGAVLFMQNPSLRGMFQAGIKFSAGGIPALLLTLSWFYFQGPTALDQFFLSASSSATGSPFENIPLFWKTILFNYRFQPSLIIMAGISLFCLAAGIIQLIRNHCKTNVIREITSAGSPLQISLFSLFASFLFFLSMIRGSTSHTNYYAYFSFFLFLFFSGSIAFALSCIKSNLLKYAVLLCVLALALNNSALAAVRTFTLFKNFPNLQNAAFEKKLEEILTPRHKLVLPPNLWFEAEKRNLIWRPSFLTLVGQRNEVYQQYLLDLIAWNPDFFIVEEKDWAARNATASFLAEHGYFPHTRAEKIFKHPHLSTGWTLKIFSKKNELSE